jgi:uncharacterized protein (DUF924 family)
MKFNKFHKLYKFQFQSIKYKMESQSHNERIEKILNFWLGAPDQRNLPPTSDLMQKWFSFSTDLDQEIKENFEEDLNKLAKGEYEDWKHDRDGRIAAVLLADQFSRNIFRKQKEAFAFDAISLEIVEKISEEEILSAKLREKAFLLLPYEHSENLDHQRRCLSLCKKILENPNEPENSLKYWSMFKSYAEKHLVIIEKFSRFPHRNEVLGRESTVEEIEYLKSGVRFGQ